MNVVLDMNVLVSAAISARSVPGRAVQVAFRRGTVSVSDELIAELSEVLRRPRLDRFASLERRVGVIEETVFDGEFVEIVIPVVACRDPKDDKFLALAVNGRADFLVTGDRDLLVLDPFRGVRILTPADFLTAVDPAANPPWHVPRLLEILAPTEVAAAAPMR